MYPPIREFSHVSGPMPDRGTILLSPQLAVKNYRLSRDQALAIRRAMKDVRPG